MGTERLPRSFHTGDLMQRSCDGVPRVRQTARERDRQTDRETERQRDRERHTHRDRQRDRERANTP